jgi:hypothetical protein
VLGCFYGGTHFHLAAFEALAGEQVAQCRFMLTQFVGKAERQVQKAAVDRTDFEPETAQSRGLVGLRFRPRAVQRQLWALA